jgi:peptidyl-prolyl cis-trans isomerase A (cyclophilin A)
VLANGLVQFGLSPNPAITKAWSTAPIKDDPVKLGNKPGVITFANAGPNTRTTQLFINIGDLSGQLDSMGFAGFGTVTEGMDVVKSLYSGYGEMSDMGGRGPNQDMATKQGKAYLEKSFPALDTITNAAVTFPEPAAAPAKPAPKSPPKK